MPKMTGKAVKRYGNGAVMFEFEGERYTLFMDNICWATPNGWARVAVDRVAFPVSGPMYNPGTVFSDYSQTFAGTIV